MRFRTAHTAGSSLSMVVTRRRKSLIHLLDNFSYLTLPSAAHGAIATSPGPRPG
jgi:hypothetical protein